MKYDIQLHAVPHTPVTPSVGVLSYPSERALDPEPFSAIVAEKGPIEAEEIVCRVLEDIALRLDVLQMVVADHQFEPVSKQARRIEQVALGLGLLDVQNIAANTAQAATQMDGVAVHALVARLERAFDAAVTEVWAQRAPIF